METFLQFVRADVQSLASKDRSVVLGDCRAFIRRLEAVEALDDALKAQRPEFQSFSSSSLKRLEALLNAVSSPNAGERLSAMQDVNPEIVIVYGLSLSIKTIERVKVEFWDEIARQARMAVERRSQVFAGDEIAQTVSKSRNEEFKTISHVPRLRQLAMLAHDHSVVMYLPELELDGLLRLTTSWDQTLLTRLFAFQPDMHDAAGFELIAVKGQVLQCLGAETYQIIQQSKAWAAEPLGNDLTQCDALWVEGQSATFTSQDKKKPYYQFEAGTISAFYCAGDCVQVSFLRGSDVITRKTPPGYMTTVPDDVTIVVNGGDDGGRAKAS
ncbi:hypothetical protein FALBO_11798 [Fusarium albosuccineum]|uniref:Uncharacterized protein n=1 Tax=Fusarium albosuccineum TaxID=1237068 RepID=A0A8H4L1N4_9HYPO|nr:hypothetical protein FALBO_11798 [Fusarium albosuccineum]